MSDGRSPADLTAEAVVGGVSAVLHRRPLQSDGPPLTDLLGPIMSMIVLPYLGPRAAGSELNGASHTRRKVVGRPPASSAADPLVDLKMRLAYPTVRVLPVIDAIPGASDRQSQNNRESQMRDRCQSS